MPLDFDPTRPIYLQIIEAVKKRTAQGIYQAGGPLPSGAGKWPRRWA